MKIFICIVLVFSSLIAEDFITKMEYAKMLYANPRGIGCNLCHGQKGEGMSIAKYKEKGVVKEFRVPAINQLAKEDFFKSFGDSNSIMPKYFLTNNEIEMLYFYVAKQN